MQEVDFKCGDIVRSSTHKRSIRVDIVYSKSIVGKALKKDGLPSKVDVVVSRAKITAYQAALMDMRSNT